MALFKKLLGKWVSKKKEEAFLQSSSISCGTVPQLKMVTLLSEWIVH